MFSLKLDIDRHWERILAKYLSCSWVHILGTIHGFHRIENAQSGRGVPLFLPTYNPSKSSLLMGGIPSLNRGGSGGGVARSDEPPMEFGWPWLIDNKIPSLHLFPGQKISAQSSL